MPVQRGRVGLHKHRDLRHIRNPDLGGAMPTAYRSKLAPPGPGQTTGHGHASPAPHAHADESDGRSQDGSDAGSVGGRRESPSKAKPSAHKVVLPEDAESQGLQYQIGIADPNTRTKATRAA